MRFTHIAPIALVALLTTSCMSPPIEPERGPPGGDHVVEEIEAHVRSSGPVTAPQRGLIDAPGTSRRLPPAPHGRAPTYTPAPSTSPAPTYTPAPRGEPGSARSYIERFPRDR